MCRRNKPAIPIMKKTAEPIRQATVTNGASCDSPIMSVRRDALVAKPSRPKPKDKKNAGLNPKSAGGWDADSLRACLSILRRSVRLLGGCAGGSDIRADIPKNTGYVFPSDPLEGVILA